MDFFNISNELSFNQISLNTFKFQYKNNLIYRKFVDLMRIQVSKICDYSQIPFLPIEFFKNHHILSNTKQIEKVFESSGTTGSNKSKHFITDIHLYKQSLIRSFEYFFKDINQYEFFILLPTHTVLESSSLLFMLTEFVNKSNSLIGGFFKYPFNNIEEKIMLAKQQGKKVVLFGVSYSLLDYMPKHKNIFSDVIIFETGGMKGMRKEIIKQELHEIIKQKYAVNLVYSEYGMTELLSQAYSIDGENFKTPPWMKILIRDTNDPLCLLEKNKTGGINIIDLANFNSCSFIATQDLGNITDLNTFKIIGRFDYGDVRGCNLLTLN